MTNMVHTAIGMAHGWCFYWNRETIVLYVVPNFLIAMAYFTIPYRLLRIIRSGKGTSMTWMFMAFIVACGITHVWDIIVIWQPLYHYQIAFLWATAALSIVTALAIIQGIPLAFNAPTGLDTAVSRVREATIELKSAISGGGRDVH